MPTEAVFGTARITRSTYSEHGVSTENRLSTLSHSLFARKANYAGTSRFFLDTDEYAYNTNPNAQGGSAKGVPKTEEHKRKIAAANLGKKKAKHSPEMNAAKAKLMRNRILSPEAQARVDESRRQRKGEKRRAQSPETIARRMAARAGYRHSEETRSRIAATNRKTREAMSPEFKEACAKKISESNKKYWSTERPVIKLGPKA